VCCVLCAVCCVLCAVCCVSSEWDGIFQKFNVFIRVFSLLLGSLLMSFARLTIADIFINVGLLVVISRLFVEISRFALTNRLLVVTKIRLLCHHIHVFACPRIDKPCLRDYCLINTNKVVIIVTGVSCGICTRNC